MPGTRGGAAAPRAPRIDARTVPHTTLDVVKALDASGIRCTLQASFVDGATLTFDQDALDALGRILDPWSDERRKVDHDDCVPVDHVDEHCSHDNARRQEEVLDDLTEQLTELARCEDLPADMADELRALAKKAGAA